ncbi:hypothetical protein EK33_08620 [Listeria monocytogenes]|nr:hypothetical protein [Listeria monocytogenes]
MDKADIFNLAESLNCEYEIGLWTEINSFFEYQEDSDNPCFCIIIKDYTDFLKKDIESKEIVMEIFKEDILPFWENGVTQTVVEGKPRSFKVYLVK